jgi:cytochrome c553
MRRALALALALVAAPVVPASSAEPAVRQVPDTLAARIAPCTQCHGEHGEGLEASTYFPRLAGKPVGYLYRQLVNFAEGRRRYPEMNYLVRQLPRDYLREIAQYFAAQHPPYPARPAAALSAADAARIDTLVRTGDAARDLPACTGCHGERLGGREPATPGLTGLFPSYVAEQLNAWRNGVRRAREPDCMARIAKRLTGEEIHLLSAWLASRHTPDAQAPEPPSSARPPLECGSLAQDADR